MTDLTPEQRDTLAALFVYEWGIWERWPDGSEHQVAQISDAGVRDALDALLAATPGDGLGFPNHEPDCHCHAAVARYVRAATEQGERT